MQDGNNFNQLNHDLQHYGALAGAAECHGFLCAQLCVVTQVDEQFWQGILVPAEVGNQALLEELRALSHSLYSQLESPELSFSLLVPGDDAGLWQRTLALADWCRGFLCGLGTGGLTEAGLNNDCRELTEDMERISHVRPDPDKPGDQGDQDEHAFMELVEFVRVGAQFIYHDMAALRRPARPAGVLH